MLCLAFPKLNIPIPNERRFQAKIDISLKSRSKFNKTLFPGNSSLVTSELIIESPRRTMVARANDGAAVMLTSGASGRINALLSLRAWRSVLRLISAFLLILLLPFRGRRRCMAVGVAPESSEKGGGKEEKSSATTGMVVRVPKKSAFTVVDKEVAARRALAIKRVVEDNGDNDDKKETVREFSLFVTSRGDTIFTQSWTPVKVQVR